MFAEELDPAYLLDAVESKLFGIGSEAYVVGSFEFYLGYAIQHQKLLCLDAGHFHPTETLADKISSVLRYVPELLLHVSRGVRWDSDHVILLDDALRGTMEELVRGRLPGPHAHRPGLLRRQHQPHRRVGRRDAQRRQGAAHRPARTRRPVARRRERRDHTARLVLLEELKTLPFGAVWDEHCRRQNVPVGAAWLDEVKAYETKHLANRG